MDLLCEAMDMQELREKKTQWITLHMGLLCNAMDSLRKTLQTCTQLRKMGAARKRVRKEKVN